MFSCACIIPFYNEGHSLLETIEVASKVAEFDQIICVDDGSNRPITSKLIKQIVRDHPQIKLIVRKKNGGKVAAVKTGLKEVNTKWVFLLDADLKNLKTSEIRKAIRLVKKHARRLKMLILRRAPYNKFVRAIRHDILMSGERILRTKDLREIYETKFFSGYQLEIAINHYFQENNKRCYWLQTSIENTYKVNKWKLEDSWESYRQEIVGFVNYDGAKTYVRQMAEFCRHSIDKLEK